MDFKRKKQEVNTGRFYWDFDPENKAWIEITTLTIEEILEISKEFTEQIVDFAKDPDTGQMVRVESQKLNKHERNIELMVRAITDWAGFSVDGGPELECTPENKKMLFNDFIEFRMWVTECVQKHKEQTIKLYGSNSERKN